ncbi:unnamed protein product [Caretta caretta]
MTEAVPMPSLELWVCLALRLRRGLLIPPVPKRSVVVPRSVPVLRTELQVPALTPEALAPVPTVAVRALRRPLTLHPTGIPGSD